MTIYVQLDNQLIGRIVSPSSESGKGFGTTHTKKRFAYNHQAYVHILKGYLSKSCNVASFFPYNGVKPR